MPFPAIGPELSPYKPQPLKILIRNGQAVNELIANPEPAPLSAFSTIEEEKRAKRIAKRVAREEQYSLARNRISSTLALYGPGGRPALVDGDGKKTLPTPHRSWKSQRADLNFTEVCVSGAYGQLRTEFEPRRIARPIKAAELRRAYEAEGFDIECDAECQAALERWAFRPWKGCISSCGELIWVEGNGQGGHWEPREGHAASTLAANTSDAQEPALALTEVSAWLVDTLTPTKRRLRKSDRTEPSIEVTAERLNAIYMVYEANKLEGVGELHAALSARVKLRFDNKCQFLMKLDKYQEPYDVLMDFTLHLMQQILRGKYKHNGLLEHWIGRCWSRFCTSMREELYEAENCTVGLNNRNIFDHDGEEVTGGKRGRINPIDVDMDIERRNANGLNDPSLRVNRLLRSLDDPTSQFGQMDADVKMIIRQLARGAHKEAIAKRMGLAKRTLNRKLKEISHMSQALFVTSDDIRENLRQVSL